MRIETSVQRSAIAALSITILLGAIIGATGVSAQSADGEITVSPTDVSIERGGSQTVAIKYDRLSNATPQGIEYTVAYDPDVVSVTDQRQGSYLDGRALVNNASTAGEVEYVEAIFDGGGVERSSGTVATLTIEPADGVEDGAASELELTTAKASEAGTAFTIATTNGSIKIDTSTRTSDDSDGESVDDESNTGNQEPQDNSVSGSEKTRSSTTTDDTNSKASNNTAKRDGTQDVTDTEQTPVENNSTDTTDAETDTSESVPGFGVTVTILSILAVNYIAINKPE